LKTFFVAAALAGSTPAFFVSLFEPRIDTDGVLPYEYWSSVPTIEDLQSVSRRQKRDGEAGLSCEVTAQGLLRRCSVAEQLGGRAFGEAARRLAGKFRMKTELAAVAHRNGSVIMIRMPFCHNVVCEPPR
jgi:TonB family protein